MPFKDLRELISKLEDVGELVRVKREVDWNRELGAVARRAMDVYGDRTPALLFENIKDYKRPKPNKLLTAVDRTYSRFAFQLGLPRDSHPRQIIAEWRKRTNNPIKHKMVPTGPCKENKEVDDKVDLTKFPAPWWHDRDGGRYLGTRTQVVTKDPETGWINVATVRMPVIDRNTASLFIRPGWVHTGYIYSKYIERDEPMPVSVAIGGPHVCSWIACQPIPAGICEYDVAGGLQGEPIKLVKSELSDLPVPADAEMVFEGTVDPREKMMEGPFGEYPGFYGSLPVPKPVLRIKSVTYRDDPILLGSLEGYPINESATIMSVGTTAFTLDSLQDHAVPGVIDACCPRSNSGQLHAIVSIRPMVEGHAHQVAQVLWGLHNAAYCYKHVWVVDEDIDPWNLEQVNFAFATMCKGSESIHIWPHVKGATIDPRIPPEEKGFWDRVVIDCTRPYHWEPRAVWAHEGPGKGVPMKYPPLSRPAPKTMEMVNKKWEEYGIEPMEKWSGSPTGLFPNWWNPEVIDAIAKFKYPH